MERKDDKPVAQIVLRWLVQREIVPVVKSVNPVRMKENLDIFDFVLSEEEMKQIATLDTGHTYATARSTGKAATLIAGIPENISADIAVIDPEFTVGMPAAATVCGAIHNVDWVRISQIILTLQFPIIKIKHRCRSTHCDGVSDRFSQIYTHYSI